MTARSRDRVVAVRSLTSAGPCVQAFLEMNCEDAACNMVGYYSTVMPVIRHQPVYVQFSNHKELKTDNSPNQEVRRVRSARFPLCTPLPVPQALPCAPCAPPA